MKMLLIIVSCSSLFMSPAMAANHDLSEVVVTVPDKAESESSNTEKPLPESPAALGELLYKNHCTGCHESNAHVRANRKARSIEDLQYWIDRWSSNQNLAWQKEQKDAVLQYLRDTYYKF